jgi:hypothetical protein
MNKISLLLLAVVTAFAFSSDALAHGRVSLKINDGIGNVPLKFKIEESVSALMSEINRADDNNRSLDLYGMNLTQDARHQLKMLWENVHFYCEESEIVERCLQTNRGYQVRNIPLIMKPVGETLNKQEYQEAVISFSKEGKITGFNLTLSMNMYSKVMQNTVEITDVRRRMEILDYVEYFRTSYNRKDLSFLRQVFSEDALIITGKVIKVRPSEVFPSGTKITYRKQNKQQYLTNLAAAFKRNRYIHVNFDDIKIVAHPTKSNVYGVTVHQSWNASNYSDEGYVFMIWDFTNEYEPKIHVRTWQPDYLDKAKGVRMNPNDVFTLGDFTL